MTARDINRAVRAAEVIGGIIIIQPTYVGLVGG